MVFVCMQFRITILTFVARILIGIFASGLQCKLKPSSLNTLQPVSNSCTASGNLSKNKAPFTCNISLKPSCFLSCRVTKNVSLVGIQIAIMIGAYLESDP